MSCYPQTFQCFIGDHHECIGEVTHRSTPPTPCQCECHARDRELVEA